MTASCAGKRLLSNPGRCQGRPVACTDPAKVRACQGGDTGTFGSADTTLAVANAAPEVRAAATHVIGANTDDGVAHWITTSRN
jgi:hypothetical protein